MAILSSEKLYDYEKDLSHLSSFEIVEWTVKTFSTKQIVLSSSLGAEDQVLTDMLMKLNSGIQIVTLDTGRLPQETYKLMDATREHYGINYRVFYPDTHEVETMVSECGPNLFYDSIEKRKRCCSVRKITPLRRALSGLSAWICGLRKEQSENRSTVKKIEWDDNFGLYKVNPLADWTEKDVWDYIRENHIPYNVLHDRGYPTIGCAPCTRAIQPGEHARAGRWWWESSQKECGLHKS